MGSIRRTYDALLAAYGPQGWWPGDSSVEVIVGAVLVQRTTWRNAGIAIRNLRDAGLIGPDGLGACGLQRLETLVRPAGFYRSKARTLHELGAWMHGAGGVAGLGLIGTAELRRLFLDIPGIGPETADSILLYAFGRPVVVIDAYLRRLCGRLGGVDFAVSDDDDLRALTARALRTATELNEFHALVVEHGKRHCRKRAQCSGCVLSSSCKAAADPNASASPPRGGASAAHRPQSLRHSSPSPRR